MDSELWTKSLPVMARFKEVPADKLDTLQQILQPILEGSSMNALLAAQVGNIKSIRVFSDRSEYAKIERAALATDIITVGTTDYYIAMYRVGESRGVRLGAYGDGLPAFFYRVATDPKDLRVFMSNHKITPKSLTRFEDGEDLWDVMSYTSENSIMLRYMLVFCENGSAAPAEYVMPITIMGESVSEEYGHRTSHFDHQ